LVNDKKGPCIDQKQANEVPIEPSLGLVNLLHHLGNDFEVGLIELPACKIALKLVVCFAHHWVQYPDSLNFFGHARFPPLDIFGLVDDHEGPFFLLAQQLGYLVYFGRQQGIGWGKHHFFASGHPTFAQHAERVFEPLKNLEQFFFGIFTNLCFVRK
jgi:hypothetical protein